MLTIPLLEVLLCYGRCSRGVSAYSGLGFDRQGTINVPSAISHVFVSFPDVQDELSTPSCRRAWLPWLPVAWHPSVLAQGVQGTDTRWPGQGKPQPPPPPDSSMALGTELKEEKASPERCSGICMCACCRQPQGFLTTGAVTADTLRV